MRVAALVWCSTIPGLQVYLFRRISGDLNKNHMEGPKGFRAMLAGWVLAGFCEIVEEEIRFWNGSKIYLCHCKDEKDIYKYQGAEIHVLLIDELTHFTEVMYRFLRNRVRMVGIELPAQYTGMFPRILCGANPGNIGHLWVKTTFVISGKPLETRRMPSNEGGMLRQYIPARLEDNPSMAEDDPGYEHRLEGLGSASLVKAMRWGDWDVIEGAFFDCWASHRHVLKPFEVPRDWDRFRSGDWGSAKPFSFGWWAIVPDAYKTIEGIWLPRGALLRYREWYGMKPGQPNVGLKLFAEKVGAGLWQREEKDPPMIYGVLDPAAFAEDGGPSIAERITIGSGERIHFTGADNKRVPGKGALGGWDQMRARFVGDDDGNPMIACFETCVDSVRTIPAMQHDSTRPEDLDSDGEDHCFAAGTMVETDAGPCPIESLVGTEGHVLSLGGGFEAYRSARMTRRNSEIVQLTFADGRKVRCTKDHKFLVDFDDWRYASDLAGRRVLCAQSSSAPRSKNSITSAITSVVDTFNTKASVFTLWFGSITTALCRAAITFIMRTMIDPTTIQATSNVSPFLPISATGTARPADSGDGKVFRKLRSPQPLGTARQKAGSGIPSILLSTSSRRWIGVFLQHAKNAAERTLSVLRASLKGSSVVTPAKRALCVSVESAGNADVYCLTVPKTGCFAIEGGILVSNCADDWRYACMSRPWVRPSKVEAEAKKDAYAEARDNYGEDSFMAI